MHTDEEEIVEIDEQDHITKPPPVVAAPLEPHDYIYHEDNIFHEIHILRGGRSVRLAMAQTEEIALRVVALLNAAKHLTDEQVASGVKVALASQA